MSSDTRPVALVGGQIIDGTGSPAQRGTVVLQGDRIVAVGSDRDIPFEATIVDVAGWVVAPGFIDMHAHSELSLLASPDHAAKITQGITTELLGQDGLSYAPVSDATLRQVRTRIRGWHADLPDDEFTWRDVAGYLARLDAGIPCNAAYLVPHGNVREMVMGTSSAPASEAELAEQCALVADGMQQGASGLSAGLTYVPGMFAGTDELVALCRVVAQYDGLFVPHHRNYGSDAIGGYAECFDIARRSGVRLHLAHTHLSFPPNRGKLPELLALLDSAQAEGIDFSFDAYPYAAAMSTLHAQFPSWSQVGTLADQREMFADPQLRSQIADATERTGSDGHSGLTIDWSSIVIAGVPPGDFAFAIGRRIAECAAEAGLAPVDFAMDLLRGTDFAASCLIFVGIESHIRELMQHPRHTVGTDGILVGENIHPRGWGSFGRFLGHYVRDQGVLSLPEAIRHITSAPADRLRLGDRGRLTVGAAADLVVFDPATIASPADYGNPRQSTVGIKDVWCNGIRTVADGEVTHRRPGGALRLHPERVGTTG